MCAKQDRDIPASTLGVDAGDDVVQSIRHTIMELLDGFS